MNKIDMINTYLSNLAVWNVKLHNLHWNVKGIQFLSVHKFTEELYEDVFEKYDEVAEHLKILGKKPLVTMKEYLVMATIEEIAPQEFAAKEVLEIVKKDMEHMKSQAAEIRNIADSDDDFSTANIFEDHIAGYAKNLWFLSSMIK